MLFLTKLTDHISRLAQNTKMLLLVKMILSTWSETKSKVISLANNLIKKMQIKTGDRVMIIGENRPEWLIADMAVKSIGAISVPT